MALYVPYTETNTLAGLQGFKPYYVSEDYRVVAAVLPMDNANSSLRIKRLYNAQHMAS